MANADSPLALYVHWPWCLAKCPYCDFNSHVPGGAAGRLDQKAYRRAIVCDLNHYASETKGRPLASVFFGGGTPSLMSPQTVSALLDAAARHWRLAADVEITLEANPTSIEAAKFRAFRRAGINRVSVGVQALNDEDLERLGREHGAEDARRALDIAGAVFDRFSFDLIYARPGQALGAWADELALALELADDHISLYQLTIEPGTPFFRHGVRAADEDLGADFYELTQDMTAAAGLPAYEISNHARPGRESRHNLTYWQGGDYVGIGPGAHGRLTRPDGSIAATHQIADPARWLAQVATQGHGTAKVRTLGPSERAGELVLAGLRLTDGIERARFRAATGLDVMEVLDPDGLTLLTDAGLVRLDETRLVATAQGRMMLNAVLERLLA